MLDGDLALADLGQHDVAAAVELRLGDVDHLPEPVQAGNAG